MNKTDDLKKQVRLSALTVAKVMRELIDGPCTANELIHISGLSKNTLYEYLRALRKEKVIHISSWEKDSSGKDSIRVFSFGSGKDASRSKKSKAQIAKECRRRKKLTATVLITYRLPVVNF